MADNMTAAQRSALMKRVRRADTTPEMIARRALHGLGYRYVLHDRKLPGSPDLVFPGPRKVIFIHGCFWHQHEGCRFATVPSSRIDFWLPKLAANRVRDRSCAAKLRKSGWKVMTVWECELRDVPRAVRRMVLFLDSA
jgi:DNA mismatch endonuclease, patch repair protein